MVGVKRTVLVIEDEESIAALIALYLEREGFRAVLAKDGESGLEVARRERPDLVLLDLMLPDVDGAEVYRRLQELGSFPVIMVTAKDSETDRVVGLELGADDYVTKPFSPRELVARVKAVLRRVEGTGVRRKVLKAGPLEVDLEGREVRLGGERVDLAPKEFELLAYLMSRKGVALSRERILSEVWGYEVPLETRTVDVHVRSLRAKLGEACPIETVWGVGYKASWGER